MGKQSCIRPSYMSSNEFLYNILYKLTLGHPKTRWVIDSMASDYKEMEAFSVASNKGIYCKFTWEKENRLHNLFQSKQHSHWLQKIRGQYAQSVIKVSMQSVLWIFIWFYVVYSSYSTQIILCMKISRISVWLIYVL